MEWIAIERQAPTEGEWVLVYDDVEGIFVGCSIGKDIWRIYASENTTKKVTHWMALPPKPEDSLITKVKKAITNAKAGEEITLPGTNIIETSTIDKLASAKALTLGVGHHLSPGHQTTKVTFDEA